MKRTAILGVTIALALVVIGGIGLNAYLQDQTRKQQRVDQLKSFGGDDSTARSFNDAYGQRFVGPDNRFNSSVRDIYIVSVTNPLLANNIDMYGRVVAHGPWPLASYAAGHLGTSYLPDGKDQVACMARLIDGVDGLDSSPAKLKELAVKFSGLSDPVTAAKAYLADEAAASQLKQARVDQVVAAGVPQPVALGFVEEYPQMFSAPDGRANSTVIDTMVPTYANNATLARIVNAGARTPGGSLWRTFEHVKNMLGTPQYEPKTEVEAKCMSKMINGVNGIENMPSVLKAYSMGTKTLFYDIGLGGDASMWDGAYNIAIPITNMIKNGTISVNGLDQNNTRRLVFQLELANTDARTGQVDGIYNRQRFLINTTPNTNLDGDSPFIWTMKTLRNIKDAGEKWYSDPVHGPVLANNIESWKNLPQEVRAYKAAIAAANVTYESGFTEAAKAYKESIKSIPEKERYDIMFAYGSADAMGIGEGWNGHYDKLAGMALGIPVERRAITYPGTGKMTHDGPIIWSSTLNRYVGPFTEVAALKKIYEIPHDGILYKMNLLECGVDGSMIKIAD